MDTMMLCQIIFLLVISQVTCRYFNKSDHHLNGKTLRTGISYENNTLIQLPFAKKWQWKIGKINKRQFTIVNSVWRKLNDTINTENHKIVKFTKGSGTLKTIANGQFLSTSIPTSTYSSIEFYYDDLINDSSMNEMSITKSNSNDNIRRTNRSVSQYANVNTTVSVKDLPIQSTKKQHVQSLQKNPQAAKHPRSIYQFRFVNPVLTRLQSRTSPVTKHQVIKVTVNESDGNLHLKASGKFHQYKYSYQVSVKSLPKPKNGDSQTINSTSRNRSNSNKVKDRRKKTFLNTKATIALEKLFRLNYNLTTVKPSRKSHKVLNNTKLSFVRKPLLNNTEDNSRTSNVDAMDEIFINKTKISNVYDHFTFLATYVYEPLQVHCDAAILSDHWLITSGSCLYRHHKESTIDAVSAYVTYCGDNWREPELINYVRYSIVHPRYHPWNTTKRSFYNIGLIEVANSIGASCEDWSVVTLINHHFTAQDGLSAYAVGWGLDKYDESSIHLAPSCPVLYEGRIYSMSYPTNVEYDYENLICLSLPPTTTKKAKESLLFGSLLLVNYKLVGLYLHEDLQSSGVAHYTGVWILSDWVADVAREPDEDSDIFTL